METPIRVIHKLSRPSLRSALANFMFNFLYESVPVFVLPSKRHENCAIQISAALDLFARSRHNGRIRDDGVCEPCSRTLRQSCIAHINELLNFVRLLYTIVSAQMDGDDSNVRSLAYFVTNLMRQALDVLAGFKALCSQKENESAKSYN